MSRRSSDLDTKIYVGDLPREASEKEIERAFSYYGRLRNVWVARNPAGFAFVEFEDPRDADDAVRGLDGTSIFGSKVCVEHSNGKRSRSICGSRVRVEHSNGKVRPKPWLRGGRGPPPRSRRPFNPDDRCYECGERGHYAYDCHRYSRRRRDRSRSRSRSRSYRRSLSHSRSRSRTHSSRRGYRSHTRSRSRSRDQSRDRSRDRSNERSRERSRDRSASPANDASP